MPAPLALLLAGPVLRRVTLTTVSVWVATSQAGQVTLDVFSGMGHTAPTPGSGPQSVIGATPAGTGTRATVQVCPNLHVCVVTASINGVPPNSLCSYNVTLDVGGGRHDLGDLGLLDDGDHTAKYSGGLGYHGGDLPSFLSPPDTIEHLRLVHGSCFKMHGVGPSALPWLDDVISDALPKDVTDPEGRPHLALLTGDQIYADDVATALLPNLNLLGTMLLGDSASPETVPLTGQDVNVSMTTMPAGTRQRLVRRTGGMSSDAAHNHLIGFTEFAAMYLMCWTGRGVAGATGAQPAWLARPAVLPDNDFHAEDSETASPTDPTVGSPLVALQSGEPAEGPTVDLVTPLFTPPAQKLLAELHDGFADDRAKVKDVQGDGDSVRRWLANVPVMMILDDHEVSDDFFITRAWRRRVLTSEFGRAVVRNGLLAAVLFQGWGNNPTAYETAGTPENQLLQLVPRMFDGSGTVPSDVRTQLDHLLGLDDLTAADDTPRVSHHFSLDIAENARLVVLDTRTHRDYSTDDGPPGLLTERALDAQLPISATDGIDQLIVVSPAPVIGPRLIEEVLTPAVTRAYDVYHLAYRDKERGAHAQADALGIDTHKPFGDLWLDVESWAAKPDSFQRFLRRVTRCPSVVILAGDVHYAASFAVDYQRWDVATVDGGVPDPDGSPSSASSRVVHFTASALRNGWMPAVATFARSITVAENLERLGFAGAMLGWTTNARSVLVGGDVAPGEPRPLRARLFRNPVVLPTTGWANVHQIRHPEWAYTVTPLVDSRDDVERFHDLVSNAGTGPSTTIDQTLLVGAGLADLPAAPSTPSAYLANSATNPYGIAARVHANGVETGSATRGIVFANNIGLVGFSRDAHGDLSASMTVLFQRAHPVDDSEKPYKYVVHASSLTASPIPAPSSVGGA